MDTYDFRGEYGTSLPVISSCQAKVPPDEFAATRALVMVMSTLPSWHDHLADSSATELTLNGTVGVWLAVDWLPEVWSEPLVLVDEAPWTYDETVSDPDSMPVGLLARNSCCALPIEAMMDMATMTTTATNTKNAPLRSRRSSRIDFNESMLGNYTPLSQFWQEAQRVILKV